MPAANYSYKKKTTVTHRLEIGVDELLELIDGTWGIKLPAVPPKIRATSHGVSRGYVDGLVLTWEEEK
jgi:hypothetical protein